MKVIDNEPLAPRTTVKIGGVAKKFYIPESVEDCCLLQKHLVGEKYYILAGGSNILINDSKNFDNVVFTGSIDNEMSDLGDGNFYCGCSVRIQKFIQYAKQKGYGGIEYLYSLPARMGGIICMNAGRGREEKKSIGDNVSEVYAVKDGEKVTVPKSDCNFNYRSSIFKNQDYLITGVLLRLNKQSIEYTDQKIKERLELCKRLQDHSEATFGTVFAQADPRIMKICTLLSPKSGITWSRKRGNWFVNDGTGTYKQAIMLINRCRGLHRILGKSINNEVCIWE